MRETFSELTKQVHLINDLILSDMVNTDAESHPGDEDTSFSRHLLATKHWFSRISWANKKRYVLALIEDLRSAWALSLLLKSMWNCRPKDAVLSVSEQRIWSSYDLVPIDHNRTATPLSVLAHVMKSDRMWFLLQEPEAQAMILSELLTISGGPVMWCVLRRAQVIYERYRDKQLHNLLECVVVEQGHGTEPVKKDATKASPETQKSNTQTQTQSGRAQKELEANLAAWNSTIKAMRDSLKLEEFEMTFNDGTKQKIWKVNRVKPEAVETVDFLQLLPSCVAKRILSYLPSSQFAEFAKVNKYWAYLVDEFKAEVIARAKIDSDFDKLNELMFQHDVSLELIEQIEVSAAPPSSQVNFSNALSMKLKPPPSVKASEKSGGAYSLRNFLNDKFNKPNAQAQKPIRNLAEISERLERRGATDENIWKWCNNILKNYKGKKTQKSKIDVKYGVMKLSNNHFPCPMMKETIEVPLQTPLYTDPAITSPIKFRRNISSMMVVQTPKDQGIKKYGLWTRDFSHLYPVMKIPSYQAPFHK